MVNLEELYNKCESIKSKCVIGESSGDILDVIEVAQVIFEHLIRFKNDHDDEDTLIGAVDWNSADAVKTLYDIMYELEFNMEE